MDFIKNDSSFTCLESMETLDLYSNYKYKKFPKLNQFAEEYLANLEKEKFINGINSNNYSKDNINLNIDIINDNCSSIKGISNEISNNDSVQLNIIKKINSKNQSGESNELKTKKYFSINNIISNKIEKVNAISILPDCEKIKRKNIGENKAEFNEKLNKYFKKIDILDKLKTPLFFDFSNNKKIKYEGKFQFINNKNEQNLLNYNKSSNILKDKKKNKNFFSKNNQINSMRTNSNNNKKLHMEPFLMKNILTSFRKENENKKNIRKQLNKFISNSLTEESHRSRMRSKPHTYITNSLTLHNYWKEKEIKKHIRIAKIKAEKIEKEMKELKEVPAINEKSKKIARKLNSNSTISVFERLADLSKNKIIINGRKMNLLNKNNKNTKTWNKIDCFRKIKANNKHSDNDITFKTFNQIEKRNKNNNSLESSINKSSNYNQIKKNNKNKINNFYKQIKQGKEIKDAKGNKIQKNYEKPKIMYKAEKDFNKVKTKAKTNRINNKYINIIKNKTNIPINDKKRKILLKNKKIIQNYNSTENLKKNKIIINKKLNKFLNKNQSFGSLNDDDYTNPTKAITNLNINIINNKKDKNEVIYLNKTDYNKTKIINNKIKKNFSNNKNIKTKSYINEGNLIEYNNEYFNTEKCHIMVVNQFPPNILHNKKKNAINEKIINHKNINNNNYNKNILKNIIINMDSLIQNNNNKTKNAQNNPSERNNYYPEYKNDIDKRKTDLLKILTFSSNIGINDKSN